MRLAVKASASYELAEETFLCLMVEPMLAGPAHRVIEERLSTSPTSLAELLRDPCGNPLRRFVAPAGAFGFEFVATIEAAPDRPIPGDAVEHPPSELPPEVLAYTLPSRYCQSDLLARMAKGSSGSCRRGDRASGPSPIGSGAGWNTATGRRIR
jgi:hypothetical protein